MSLGGHMFKQALKIIGAAWVLVIMSMVPITASAGPQAKDFGTLPMMYDAALSPNGKQLAVFLNVRGQYAVRIIDLDNIDADMRIIGLGGEAKPEWIKWANNDRVLVSVWKSEKIRTTPLTAGYIYTLDTKSMDGKILIKPRRDTFRQFNNNVVDFLEDDPDHILMSFSDTDTAAPDVQKVNVQTGKYDRVKRGSTNIQSWYTDLSGTLRVGQGISDRSTKEARWTLRIADASGENWQEAKNFPGLEPDTGIIGFTGNPNELIIRALNGRNTRGLYIYDLSQKRTTRTLFENDAYDAGGVVLSGDGKRVIGTTLVSDQKEVKLFDGEDTVLSAIRRKYVGYTIDYVDQSYNGEFVIARMSNAYDPGTYILIQSDTLDVTTLGAIRPGLMPEEMGEVIALKYRARDGKAIPGYVTIPASVTSTAALKNLPFIVLPHGGPYARDSQRFDYFAQFFAAKGYGVLQMNFRGSAGYGEAYEDAGRDNWVVMQEDIEDGAKWLVSKGYADPERMCIVGWSFGGYAALMGAIKNPELYKCAASMAGVTDLANLVSDQRKYRFGALAANTGVLAGFDGRRELRENSPVKRADELTIPLFLAHGTLDERVHFDQFTRMRRALGRTNPNVTYVEFPNEDHFLSNQENRQKFFIELEKFLVSVNGESEFAQ